MSYLLFLVWCHLSVMEFYIPELKIIGAGQHQVDVLEFRAMLSEKNIDREARTIDNVILAQAGEAKGHQIEIEQSFLDDMSKYVERKLRGRVQCNMGHQWDALGYQLGYFSDLKVVGKQFIGKLTTYKAADKSPELPGMADWFFDLAEEDAQAVMCSIRFVPKHYYQYDEKGQKVIIKYYWYSGPEKAFADKPAYVAFEKLISCDIVESGALTESLFSDNGSNMQLRSFVRLLNEPSFIEFLEENSGMFPKLGEFYKGQFEFSFTKSFANLFKKSHKVDDSKNTQPKAGDDAEKTVDNADTTTTTQDFTAAIEAALKPVRDQVANLTTQLGEKTTELEALKKKVPAATITGLKTEDDASVDLSGQDYDEEWMQSPMNQKVAALTAKRRKQPAK